MEIPKKGFLWTGLLDTHFKITILYYGCDLCVFFICLFLPYHHCTYAFVFCALCGSVSACLSVVSIVQTYLDAFVICLWGFVIWFCICLYLSCQYCTAAFVFCVCALCSVFCVCARSFVFCVVLNMPPSSLLILYFYAFVLCVLCFVVWVLYLYSPPPLPFLVNMFKKWLTKAEIARHDIWSFE